MKSQCLSLSVIFLFDLQHQQGPDFHFLSPPVSGTPLRLLYLAEAGMGLRQTGSGDRRWQVRVYMCPGFFFLVFFPPSRKKGSWCLGCQLNLAPYFLLVKVFTASRNHIVPYFFPPVGPAAGSRALLAIDNPRYRLILIIITKVLFLLSYLYHTAVEFSILIGSLSCYWFFLIFIKGN